MSWLKMGRWLLVGVVVVNGAAACGGRASLPTGEDFGDNGGNVSFGGARSTAGAAGGIPTAGSVGVAGGPSFGGVSSFGGAVSAAGNIGIAGSVSTGGSSSVCIPGFAACLGDSIAFCDGTGMGLVTKSCGPGSTCVQNGDVPTCQQNVCAPGSVQCDVKGDFVQVCSADGRSLLNKINCAAQGQHCLNAACQTLVCQPNQLFCSPAGVRLCNPDGTGSNAWQNCGPAQFCDPMSLRCAFGVCTAGQPACNGSVATTCNGNGSGYLAGGVDCAAQPNSECVDGSCECAAGSDDCDNIAKNGCETSVVFDPDNCGGCGLSCSANHVKERLCDGVCDGTCQAGFGDCDGDMLKDGCETNVSTDTKNCGGCGLACSVNNITPTCAKSVCGGVCKANFNDCNGNKQLDGCESDARSDAKNCGACGVVCSSNHVKPACAAGACSGDCAGGFADCNANKQTDGCEINTQTDKANCGKCSNACPAGQACASGKCSALLTFSGIAQNLPIASLVGWSQCFSETYGQVISSVQSVENACAGSMLMMACRKKGSSVLDLAAYAPRADVLFDTGTGDTPHNANNVGWYFNDSESWGFAPQGDVISRNSCDVEDSSLKMSGVDGAQRLCWHTSVGFLQGGWRCGKNDSLNDSVAYERLLFQVP